MPQGADTTDLPTVKVKKPKVVVRAMLEDVFGRNWRLIRPNQILTNRVMGGTDGNVDIGALNDYFRAHVHPDEQAEFLRLASEEPGVDIEYLMELMQRMSEAVYDALPSEPS